MPPLPETTHPSPFGDLTLRSLALPDLSPYFSLLSQLTIAPEMTSLAFDTYLTRLSSNPDQFVFVAVLNGTVVATASVLIEHKAVRGGGCVGHVEDVVVDKTCRGGKVGKILIERLCVFCRERGCYKVILDCADENVGFYEKSGFARKEVQMAKYF